MQLICNEVEPFAGQHHEQNQDYPIYNGKPIAQIEILLDKLTIHPYYILSNILKRIFFTEVRSSNHVNQQFITFTSTLCKKKIETWSWNKLQTDARTFSQLWVRKKIAKLQYFTSKIYRIRWIESPPEEERNVGGIGANSSDICRVSWEDVRLAISRAIQRQWFVHTHRSVHMIY